MVLDLVEYSQKNEALSCIIHVEELIIFFSTQFFQGFVNSYDFMFTNSWLNIPEILQCLHKNIFKSMFNQF